MFFGGKFGAKRGMYVLLRWLWKWQGLVQREGQARQGCLKRVCPKFRKDAKQIKHTQTLTLRKASGIVRSGGHGRVMWALLKNYGFTTGHHFNKC